MLNWGGTYLVCTAIKHNFKEQITHIKDLCKHMEIEITLTDLKEKKLFSCTNSTVIEDWNVTHIVEIKTVSFFQ